MPNLQLLSLSFSSIKNILQQFFNVKAYCTNIFVRDSWLISENTQKFKIQSDVTINYKKNNLKQSSESINCDLCYKHIMIVASLQSHQLRFQRHHLRSYSTFIVLAIAATLDIWHYYKFCSSFFPYTSSATLPNQKRCLQAYSLSN